MIRLTAFFAVASLLLASLSYAAPTGQSVRFKHLSREDGLSQSFVHEIAQDDFGFMWFGTQEGLNRYDGYEFRVFRHEPDDPTSIADSAVMALLVDTDGTLWVGTEHGGLSRYQVSTASFKSYRHDPVKPNSIPSDRVRSLYEDRNGTLWIGTDGAGISAFDPSSETFSANRGFLAPLAGTDVWSITEDGQGFLWVGTNTGLFRISVETGQLIHFKHNPNQPTSLSDDHVRKVFEDSAGVIWVGTDQGGLNRFNRATGDFDHFSKKAGEASPLSNDRITDILEDDTGILWIGTFDGLNAFDRERGAFVSYRHQSHDRFSLSHNTVMSIFQDRGNVLWVGTYKGLNSWNTATGAMRHYKSGGDSKLANDMITSFVEDVSGEIWIGTFGGGLHRFNEAAGTFTRYPHDPGNTNSPLEDRIMSLATDRSGSVWVGTRASGLSRIDRDNGSLVYTHFESSPEPGSLSANGVTSILEDSTGTLWIGTFGGGLNRFDAETETFEHFRADAGASGSISSDRVLIVFEDSDQNVWVGTQNGGLNLFDRTRGTFRVFTGDAETPEGLGYITMITEDADRNLWIGTHGQGLFRWDVADRDNGQVRFKRFTERHGLPSATIYAGEFVPGKHLWMSTNEGLARLDVYTEQFSSFGVPDGLQDAEFNLSASLIASDGKLYFGGVNGFNIFTPNKINLNLHLAPTVITEIKKVDRDVNFANEIVNGTLTLDHKDYFVAFRFAGLDYTASEKNRYRYMLEGLDSGWIESGLERQATYTNLSPGEYTFRVQSANSSGVWNERDARIDLQVLAAPWLSWWAYTLYSLAILGILLYLLRNHYAKIQSAKDLLVINETLEEEVRVRQRREGELSLERDRSTRLMQVAEVVMIELDRSGRIVAINEKGLALLKRDEPEVIGSELSTFIPESQRDEAKADLEQAIRVGFFRDIHAEFPVIAEDGSESLILWRAGPVSVDEDHYASILISGMDVTEIRSLEKAVREKEKMTVMGTLAGGIAHDFNNILTAIYGYGVLTVDEVEGNNKAKQNLDRILQATDRAKDLIARLLTYARSEETEFKPTNIGAIVQEAGELLAGSLPSTIKLDVNVTRQPTSAIADATQIHQVLMNLCTNASKAMKNGHGSLGVSVQRETLDSPPRSSQLLPGDYVVLRVTDDGVGMGQETLDKIFDPFFTTNTTGYGGAEINTGLGLSVVYSIVASHNGHLTVDSTPDVGSTFTIYLPCSEKLADEQAEKEKTETSSPARIIFVDDEEQVGDVGSRILKKLGYDVTLFLDPVAALESIRVHLDEVDLVITDETMPHMTGSRLATEVRKLNPDVPIIIASGNSHAVTTTEEVLLLSKPYTVSDIKKAIAEALKDDAGPPSDDPRVIPLRRNRPPR